MTSRAHPLRRIKLVYRHSSMLLKCAVLAAIVLSIVALITLRSSVLEVQAQNQVLRSQAAELEAANQELKEDISSVGSEESVKKIATEELGLVDPKSTFFTPAD